MASSRALEFYYDVRELVVSEPALAVYTKSLHQISCPFAYIASTKIEGLASRTGANVIWRPVLLGAIYRATNAPQGAGGSASDVFNAQKRRVTSQAFKTTLQRTGVEYNEPPRHPQKTTAALRLLYSVSNAARPALSSRLFRAYWVEGKNVSDLAVLQDCVRNSNIPNQDAVLKSLSDGSFESATQRRELEISTDLAVQRGSPGVPCLWIADEIWYDKDWTRRTGRLYWGQDRFHFAEAVLLALNEGKNGEMISEISKPLRSLMPRAKRSGIPAGEEIKLQFWYDFSSPWAFLGFTQLQRLRRDHGERLQIEMKPFLLGILFRQIGAPNAPSTAISAARRQQSNMDHTDWVRWWNGINEQDGKPDKPIEFVWASTFPIRSPTILRAVLVEPDLVSTLYRACWERNLNMSDDKVLHSVIAEAGYNADDVLTRANSPEVKKDLRNRTAEAKETGLCGVPSYRVFRRKADSGDEWRLAGHMVWGQDNSEIVEDLIAGWDGESRATVDESAGGGARSRL